MKLKVIGLCAGLLFLSTVHGQVQSVNWEKYLEQLEDSAEQSQLLEQLEDLLKHPLNLNEATLPEMLFIPGFPERGAYAILQARGKIKTLTEAKSLITDDDELWSWLSRFLTVERQKTRLSWNLDGRIRISAQTEKSHGFVQHVYQGSPAKIYQRYRFQIPGRFTLATVLEKDPGETTLADHLTYSLEYDLPFHNSKLVLGNYTVNLGMGLMVWSPFSVRKGGDPFYSAGKSEKLVRPYLSSYEARYLQGVVIQSSPGRWHLLGWLSDAKTDATIAADGGITSFYEAGYHRTALEQEKANQAAIKTTGFSVGRTFLNKLTLRINHMELRLNPFLQTDQTEPLDFQFHGKEQRYSGLNFRANLGDYNVFGESVWQRNQGNVFLAGAKVRWHKTRLLVLYRHYSPNYFNPFSQGFGESANTNNESGWYMAFAFSPARKIRLILAADLFATLWKSYTSPLPRRGSDIYFQWEQRINSNFRFYLRYTSDQKEQFRSTQLKKPFLRELILPEIKNRVRFHFTMRLTHDSKMNGRVETVHFSAEPQPGTMSPPGSKTGWLFYWDLQSGYFPHSNLSVRITFFDSPAYESRLYQFENDLPGILSSKLLYGRGVRFYFLVKVQLLNYLQIAAKYSSTAYEDRQTIGSGWNMIESNTDHFLSCQIDWQF